MDVEVRFARFLQRKRQIGEGGVEEVARRWRDEGERIFLRQLRRALRRFARGRIGGQRVHPQIHRGLTPELALARGRGEIAFGERREPRRHIEPLPALGFQRVPLDAGHARIRRLKRLTAEVFVRVAEAGVGKAHARGEQPEHLAVGLRLAHRRDRRCVGENVQMAVGLVHVVVLELSGGRQHDIGVVGGVGEENFVHHGEQVLAPESGDHLLRVRAHRHRVVVVDIDRAHRRLGRCERVAERRLVDGARPVRHQVGSFECRVVHAIKIAGGERHPPRGIAPVPGERRQAGDGAHRHAAAGVPLHTVIEPDRRRPRAGVLARQRHDLLSRETANGRRLFRRIVLHPLLQLRKAEGMAPDVIVIVESLADDHVHHAQGQRGIGAGQRRQVPVAFRRRQAAVGVDRDHLGAAALRLLHARPEVQVGDDGVGAPDEDQLRFVEALRVHADTGTKGDFHAYLAGRRTQRAIEQRRAELVEEAPVHRSVLHQPHGAGVAAGQDGLRLDSGDLLELRRDGVERLVPGDALEPAFAFRTDAPHWMEHAIPGVGAVKIARDLGAQRALGERHVLRALHLYRNAVLHADVHAARVGTVMRAGGVDDLAFDAGLGMVGAHEDLRDGDPEL